MADKVIPLYSIMCFTKMYLKLWNSAPSSLTIQRKEANLEFNQVDAD